MHWGIREYVTDLEKRIGRKVDCVLINSKFPSEEQVVLYELQEGDGVLVLDDYEDGNVLRTPLLSHVLVARQEGDSLAATRSFIRHDSQQLAKVIINYIHTYNESDF
jgi:hypothetical protein